MSRTIRYGDAEIVVPDDFTDEDVRTMLEARGDGEAPPPEDKGALDHAGRAASAFTGGAADWALMGWADEYRAGMRSLGNVMFGEGHWDELPDIFHEYAQAERAANETNARDYPVSTGAGRVVGGTALALVSPSAQGATLASNIGTGAAMGAATGAGAAETPEDRAIGSGIGAAAGGTIAAAPAVATAAGKYAVKKLPWLANIPKAVKSLGDKPDKRAAKLIMKQMIKGRNAEIEAAELRRTKLQPRAGGDVEETVGEMFDPNVQGLQRAVATVPGPGRTHAADVLAQRRAGIRDRLTAAVTRTKKGASDFIKIVAEAKQQRREESASLYAKAHSAKPPINADEIVAPIVDLDIGRKAAREGAELLDAAMGLERDPRVRAQMAIDRDYLKAAASPGGDPAAASAAFAKGPSMRAMDYLQRGLARIAQKNPNDTQMAAAANALQDRIVDNLSKHSAAFKTAFNTYREQSSNIDFYQLGRKAPSMTELQIVEAMERASKADKDTFAVGFAQGLSEALDRGEASLIAKFQRQAGFRKALQAAIPEDVFPVLEKRINREAAMLDTDTSVTKRAKQLAMGEDIKAATDDNPADAVVENVIRNGGNIKQGLMNQAAKAYRAARRPGIYNKQANAKVTEHLWAKATPENLKKLDNFLLEHTDPPQVETPNVGLGPWVSQGIERSADPHGQTQSFKDWRDSFADEAPPEQDDDAREPDISPGMPRRHGPSGIEMAPPETGERGQSPQFDDAGGHEPVSYRGDSPLLEDSGDGWVNDPVTGAWRLRRPGDRVRPNQSLFVDIRS